MAKPILLSVDDDSDVLRAIERDLRSQYGAEYRVIGSDSPEAALGLLDQLRVRNDTVALLLADQRMPRIDAMGGKGELRVRTFRDDSCVVVEIGDNGPGISPEVKSHIFEPFFTTKGVGEGTGLGLDTVQRIVKKHRGNIQVTSKPGDTRFQSVAAAGRRRSVMSSWIALLLALCIGLVAGLRSMTAPALVAWAAYLGWINLSGSPLSFMGSVWAVAIFSLGALAEFVADQLPTTPARTTAVPLTARITLGLLSGACLAIAGGASLWLGALIGAIGGVAGAYGGYQARVGLVRKLNVRDIVIAIPEDLVAIGLGLLFVSRF